MQLQHPLEHCTIEEHTKNDSVRFRFLCHVPTIIIHIDRFFSTVLLYIYGQRQDRKWKKAIKRQSRVGKMRKKIHTGKS
jgi:hypothetical protein